jgi:outer membrane protein assembly factor BamB
VVDPGSAMPATTAPRCTAAGVAYDGGRVYATNGLGYVAALDAGMAVWCGRSSRPVRCAANRRSPTAAVYVMSQDNQLYSLKASDGATNWSNAAALEIAGVFGAALRRSAGTVVAGFSSGELNAYRYEKRPPGVAGRAGRGPP